FQNFIAGLRFAGSTRLHLLPAKGGKPLRPDDRGEERDELGTAGVQAKGLFERGSLRSTAGCPDEVHPQHPVAGVLCKCAVQAAEPDALPVLGELCPRERLPARGGPRQPPNGRMRLALGGSPVSCRRGRVARLERRIPDEAEKRNSRESRCERDSTRADA